MFKTCFAPNPSHFLFLTVVGFLAGIILMVLWWLMRKPIIICAPVNTLVGTELTPDYLAVRPES